MKTNSAWSHRPYRQLLFAAGDIYISRIAPDYDFAIIEWLPLDGDGEYEVFLRKFQSNEPFQSVLRTAQAACKLAELSKDTDYEFYIFRGNKKSRFRLFRTGAVFGSVVNYLHPEDGAYSFSGQYLCSPSLLRLDDGVLLASMDVYARAAPQNLTLIFRSDDDGKSWGYVSELYPCFWGKMFIHKDELYMLSVTTEYGSLQIGKSTDCGVTFTNPVILFQGSNGKNGEHGVHKNPQPIVEYNGRLYNTMEFGSWGRGSHASMVMSCGIDDNLLDPNSWLFSDPVNFDNTWKGLATGESRGTIEGSLAVCPDGKLRNFMRYQTENCTPNYGLIASFLVQTDNPELPLIYDGTVEFPANLSKFEIQYDEVSKKYYSIASYIRNEQCNRDRNLLALMASEDLKTWTVDRFLVDMTDQDPKKVGLQYVDFIFDKDDIILLCRTAINNAHNFHDSNYSVFMRVKNFRG